MTISELNLKEGQHIGPYMIKRLIGKGGMGEVYLAYDASEKREVALKIIQPSGESEVEPLKRFLNEGRALSLIHNNNVVAVYSAAQYESYHYIAMEYVEGRSLSDICNNFALPARDAVPLFLQLVDGLMALHMKGIVHRDLKPQNIIYRHDDVLKILDLGIAKVYGDETLNATLTGTFIGTIRYLAPEIACGKDATPASDIWSLGAIFYEILTGTLLIPAENQIHALSTLLKLNVQFPPEAQNWCEPEMQEIVKKMCALQESNRYRSTRELKRDLLEFAKNYPQTGRSRYQVIGGKVSNINEVKQQLSQKGYTKSISKRIIAEALNQANSIGLKRDDITEVALTRAIRHCESQKSKHLRKHTLNVAHMIMVPAVSAFIFSWYQNFSKKSNANTTPVVVTVPPPAPTPTPAVASPPPPVSPTMVAVAPVPEKPETTTTLKPDLDPESTKIDVSDAFNAMATQFSQQAPEIIRMPQRITLQLANDGRFPASFNTIDNVPEFSWKPLIGATNYRFEISKDSDFRKFAWLHNTNNNSVQWDQVKPGDYFWRVRGSDINGNDSNYSEVTKLSVRAPAAILPKLLRTKIERGEKSTLDLNWARIPFAEKYRLTVSDKNGDIVYKDIIAETQHRISLPAGSYSAKVTGLDSGGNAVSDESQPMQLQVFLGLTSPTLMSPEDSIIVAMDVTSIIFVWKKIDTATSYRIELSQDPSFKNIFLSQKISNNRFVLKQKLKSGSYFWRVQAVSEGSYSDWSPARSLFAEATQ